MDISPSVERAADAAAARAVAAGADPVRLVDWLFALLEDDDGRPAELLARLGVDVPAVRAYLAADANGYAAPPRTNLLHAASKAAVRLRGDPSPMSDMVMLAVLGVDPRFTDPLAPLGVTAAAVEAALRSPLLELASAPEPISPEPVVPPPAKPAAPAGVLAARVVDANLNRARESLRVLDDYVRFVLNDRVLTEEVKAVRHRVAAAAEPLGTILLAARDTVNDVGTSVSVAGEYDRGSPAQVAAVNCKRLQEALRSAEEFGKLLGPAFARAMEAARYAAYTLEKLVVRGSAARERLATARLYVLVTAAKCRHGLERTVREAVAGGADVIQLREKGRPDRELLALARDVRRWTREANALFIMNDRPDIARLAEADGVHLGQDDLPLTEARRVVGDMLVGVSTHDLEQLRTAVRGGADYLGVGPTFPSSTKAFEQFAGPEFVRAAAAETSLPAYALGGIDADTIGRAIDAGARRVAVSAAVLAADDPRAAAAQLKHALASTLGAW